LGGLDIVKELAESGELTEQLPTQQTLDDRYGNILVCWFSGDVNWVLFVIVINVHKIGYYC